MSAQTSWISPLAKTGYAAKGIVYTTIGVLAALAAFGGGGEGETTGSSGALQTIQDGPFGNILLILLGVGLAAYALYRLLGAFVDLEGEGTDGEGLAKRAAYLGSGLSYAALSFAAFTGLAGSGGEEGKEDIAAKVLTMPGGKWIVAAFGLIFVFIGFRQWWKSAKGKYKEKFDLDGTAAAHRGLIERVAKLGLSARGLVFVIIGIFITKAGITSDPEEVKGLEGALDTLAAQPYGPWLLGITAVGLICYGIYCGIIAIYGSFRQKSVGS